MNLVWITAIIIGVLAAYLIGYSRGHRKGKYGFWPKY